MEIKLVQYYNTENDSINQALKESWNILQFNIAPVVSNIRLANGEKVCAITTILLGKEG